MHAIGIGPPHHLEPPLHHFGRVNPRLCSKYIARLYLHAAHKGLPQTASSNSANQAEGHIITQGQSSSPSLERCTLSCTGITLRDGVRMARSRFLPEMATGSRFPSYFKVSLIMFLANLFSSSNPKLSLC
ncbi:hypothetical protein CCUS01_17324 [Colletotrichum cuscutae]|uniref:Uncharacterized protein n=1 Tax=Colletotrichum cuscutae TaxID=1209917 RepID=A0AAI9V5V7_9PEZI|nr:hypothetical protein CCUS01_17324 [Colletotrichum cuscutae]